MSLGTPKSAETAGLWLDDQIGGEHQSWGRRIDESLSELSDTRVFRCWFIPLRHQSDPAYHVCQNLTINDYTRPRSAQDLSALTPVAVCFVLLSLLS